MEEKRKIKNYFKIILKILLLLAMIAILTGGLMLALSLIFYGQTYFNSDYKNANLVMLMGTTGQLSAAILFLKFILKKKADYIYFKEESLQKTSQLDFSLAFCKFLLMFY